MFSWQKSLRLYSSSFTYEFFLGWYSSEYVFMVFDWNQRAHKGIKSILQSEGGP